MPKEPKARIFSAGYGGYAENFSNHFFNDPVEVVHSVKRIKACLGNPTALEWGKYQKYAPEQPENPDNWNMDGTGGAILYDNWEAAVDEAREDLAKLPRHDGDDGPDPDHPAKKATMLQHLDRAVTIALLEKYQVGRNPPESGIPVRIIVNYQDTRWRRHRIRTKWDRRNNANPKFNCAGLTITMTCPNGGWIGTALWRDYDGSQGAFTRYTATYVVPPLPTNKGQIIFIFNGLESIPGGNNVPAILQPVLQWTPEGGPDGMWAVRSWYVPASYDPSFRDMPKLGDAKEFKPNNLKMPAWTEATQVYPGETLQGILEKNGNKWVSKFQRSAQDIAESVLTVENVSELTYPVAVIEAYMPPRPGQRPDRVPNDGLVASVTMTDVTLRCENGTPRPNWDTGSDAGASPIEKGTNNLKRYSTVATFNDGTGTSMIKFTLKGRMATAKTPDWEGTPSLWRRLLRVIGWR